MEKEVLAAPPPPEVRSQDGTDLRGPRHSATNKSPTAADRLANALRDRGVAKGDRVAYLGENHPSFVETFFACGLLGAIFVPLNTRLAAPEMQFQLEDSGRGSWSTPASLGDARRRGAAGTAVTSRSLVRPIAGGDTAAAAASRAGGVEDYRGRRGSRQRRAAWMNRWPWTTAP